MGRPPYKIGSAEFYEKAEPIVGPRVSFTKTAKAIIGNAERRAEPSKATPVLRIVDTAPVAKIEIPFRENLFAEPLPELAAPEKPRAPTKRPKLTPLSLPLPLALGPNEVDMLVDLRRRGMSCAAIGERIGLSRQQVNNAAVLRFHLGAEATRRLMQLTRAA